MHGDWGDNGGSSGGAFLESFLETFPTKITTIRPASFMMVTGPNLPHVHIW